MTPALIYLQWHSARNRLVTRLKRLKQPKYLAGAIVGGAYFYFYFFRFLFHMPGARSNIVAVFPETLALLESLAALVLCVVLVMAWIIPHERAALTFTEAEIAFLFPAPIKRRGLIHFKLIRSQVRIFFTIFFFTLIFHRSDGQPWIHAAGAWLVLSTVNLHLIGSSFARTLLLERGISNWQRRLVILGVVVAGSAFVFIWVNRTLPRLDLSGTDNFESIKNYAAQVMAAGPLPWLLLPFRLLVQPYFSPDPAAFLQALGPALLVLLLHYAWVVRSDVAFEEASVEASQRMADRIVAARAGYWRGGRQTVKKKPAPFRLRPVGFPVIAIFWKNLIGAGQMFSPRLWIMLAVVAAAFLISSGALSRGSNLVTAAGMMGAMFLAWSLLVGPQILRQDLRRDLAHADVLKSFPLRGWQIVLGELLAPTAILTGIQWLLLIFASAVLWQIPHLTAELRTAILFAAAILLPLLNSILLLIPNAGVLLFPAWFQTGKDGPQGIEATGQRLIMMLGQLLAFALALIPAAICFMIVFFGLKLVITPALALVPAAVAAALVLGLEAWLGVMLLGRMFDHFDLSAEPTG